MQFISVTEATQTLATIIDKIQYEPIVICKENRDVAVILSIEDYQNITKINIQEFQEFRETVARKAQERGLTEDKLNEILAME